MAITNFGRALSSNFELMNLGGAISLGTGSATVSLHGCAPADLAEIVEWGVTLTGNGTGTGTYTPVTLEIRESDSGATVTVGSALASAIDADADVNKSHKGNGVSNVRIRQGSRFVLNVTVSGTVSGAPAANVWAIARR